MCPRRDDSARFRRLTTLHRIPEPCRASTAVPVRRGRDSRAGCRPGAAGEPPCDKAPPRHGTPGSADAGTSTAPGFARSVREGRPVRCDDPEPQAHEGHEGVVYSIEAALPRPRVGAERGLAAYESHLDQRRKRLGQTRGRPTEAAGDFADPMCARPYRVEQRAQCRRRRDFLQQQPVGLAVQGSRRVQHQRVHRGVEIGAERLRKLPVTGHPAPQRVCGDQVSRPVEWNRLAQISGLQGPHGEGFGAPGRTAARRRRVSRRASCAGSSR